MRPARISWIFSPEDLRQDGHRPSLWACQKMVLRALLQAVLGAYDLEALIKRAALIHRSLASTPRRRKNAFNYPFRALT
jgi:hypothetical protein